MKNLNKISIFVLLLSLITISCSEDEQAGYIYNGDGARVYGFQNPSTKYSYFADIGVVEKEIPVIHIGGADGTVASGETVLTYIVDTAGSTAVEGVEFDFVDTSGQLTIADGEEFAMFPVNLNTGNFDPNAATILKVTLTSATNGGVISTLNESVEITFIGCQSTLADYTYDVVVTQDDGSVTNQGIEGITSPSVNLFHTETTGRWAAGAYTANQGYEFTDVCGELVIANQGLFMGLYGNQVYTVNPGAVAANGDFEITYAITFSGEPTFYTAVYTKQ